MSIAITNTTTEEASGRPDTERQDWQRVSLFVGGVLFAAGNMLHPLQHNDAAYESGTWEAAHLTIFFSLPFLVLGLPYLHRQLSARIGRRLSTISVAASVVGLIGIAPGTVIEAFVAPMVGHEAMRQLESGGMAVVNGLLGGCYLGGTIALGWAVRRAGLRPRLAGYALIVSAVVLVAVMSSTSALAGAIIIAATMTYGLSLAALAIARQPSLAR
jgi:hypothetical protein